MRETGEYDGVALPPEVMQAVDRARRRFEAEWQAGRSPEIDAFLNDADESARALLLPQLVAIEIDYRRRAGDEPTPDEYESRFPELLTGLTLDGLDAMVGTNTRTSTFGPDSDRPVRPETPAPKTLGRYEISRRIGRGAFGTVYLGWDPQLDREVAIKVPRLRDGDVEQQIQDLINEARRAVRLERHKGIVPVYDVGREGDVCYIVSQYIDGGTLTEFTRANKQTLAQKLNLIARLADIIHFAHEQGWIHRDVKPSNILIDADGNPYLTDFGLTARSEELERDAGAPKGTPNYMAPELIRQALPHLRGEESGRLNYDPRADVYSLGVVLYELLARRLPFEAATITALFEQVLNVEPLPPSSSDDDIPAQLDKVCLRALAKDPGERYKSAADLRDQLRAIATVLDDSDTARMPAESTSISLSPAQVLAVVAAGVLLLVIGLIVFFVSRGGNQPIAPHGTAGEQQIAQTDNSPPAPKADDRFAVDELKDYLRLEKTAEFGAASDDKRVRGFAGGRGDPPGADAPSKGRPFLKPINPEVANLTTADAPPSDVKLLLVEADRALHEGQRGRAFDLALKVADELNDAEQFSQCESVARKLVEIAEQEAGQQPLAFGRLGRAQYHLGFYDEAIATLEHAAKLAREENAKTVECEILVTLGNAQSRAGKNDEALASFSLARALIDDGAPGEVRERLLTNWFLVLVQQGKADEARARLNELGELADGSEKRLGRLVGILAELLEPAAPDGTED